MPLLASATASCLLTWMSCMLVLQEQKPASLLTYVPVGKGYGHYRRAPPCLAAFIAMDGMYAGFAGAKTGISHRKICVQLRNLVSYSKP